MKNPRVCHWLLLVFALVFLAVVADLSLRGASMLFGSQLSLCRNGVVDPREQCDDGNLNNHDGCSTGCKILTGWSCMGSPSVCHQRCGNSTVNPEFGEQCDDQNTDDGDGCSRVCTIEKGWTCEGDPSRCHCAGTASECGLISCGDGALNAGEQCDNGPLNGTEDNGCNANCSLMVGFVCRGETGGPGRCTRDINLVLLEEEKLKQKILKATGL